MLKDSGLVKSSLVNGYYAEWEIIQASHVPDEGVRDLWVGYGRTRLQVRYILAPDWWRSDFKIQVL